jgi:predicted nucleic acid-binding protein
MYLVDTSVWIDFLRERDNSAVRHFIRLLEMTTPFAISGLIYQEILQGATSQKDFDQLSTYLGTQNFLHPKNNILSHQKAAWLFFACRHKGLTVRSATDCLIAQIALEHNLVLLHNDKDFEFIKKVAPELKLAS